MTVVDDLQSAGLDVSSVWDLFNKRMDYRSAIPILVDWLPRVPDLEKEGIARALTVKAARGVALGPLIDAFKSIPFGDDGRLALGRWAIVNAIWYLWDDAYFDELAAIVTDKRYGDSRQMVAMGLGRSKRPEAGDVALSVLDEHEISGHATDALWKMKRPEARPGLERMLNDDRAWVRRCATKGLAALDRLEDASQD